MGINRRQFLLSSLKLLDLFLMVFSFLLASRVAMEPTGVLTFEQFLSIRIKLSNIVLFIALLAVWQLIFSACGLYASRRLLSRRKDAFDILKAVTWGSLSILAAALMFHVRLITPKFFLVFWVAAVCLGIVSRLAMRNALGSVRRRGRNLRHILIVGTNVRAIELAKQIAARPEYGYHLVGFVDEVWKGLDSLSQAGYKLVCSFDGLVQYLRDAVVDEVFIAVPLASLHSRAAHVATVCEEQGIVVRVLSNMFNLKVARARTEDLEGAPIISHYTGASDGWPLVAKRILDIILALLLLAAAAPLMLITALLIKLTSRGPVLFCQSRVGLNKRVFKIYKFRTMIPTAEQQIIALEGKNEVTGPVFKMKNDPRVTPIGRILRKTSIDEFPQLFNVVKGEMSLVGPRPLPVRDYQGFNQDWQRRRFSVRPGITCLWQVNGRSSIPFDQWMQLDLQYIDKWSLWLDVEILLRTIPAVLRGSGAA